MPPVRRSTRLKRTRAKAASAMSEVDRFYTRAKQRREICHKRLPPADRALQLVMSGLCSDDSKLQLHSTTQLLNMVSVEENPLIDEVVQAGAVPRLVEFLTTDDHPKLQFEALRVLKNIAAENTEVVIDSGAVPVFVKLLKSSDLETCEQVAWALGNIAGESLRSRDIVLDGGALSPLLTLCEKHNTLSFLRIGTWSLTNIFEGKPKVPFDQLEFAIRTFATIIVTKDVEVLKEASWALLYMSQCKGGIGTAMYEADLCLKLAYIFEDAPMLVLFPALRAIMSILRWTEPEKLDKRIFEIECWVYKNEEYLRACFEKDERCLYKFVQEVSKIKSSMEAYYYLNSPMGREMAKLRASGVQE